MPKILFVAGLGPTTGARELGEVFERYGRITRCDIVPPKRKHSNDNPYAFVEFFTSRDAVDALESLNRTHFKGYLLKISWAKQAYNQDSFSMSSHSANRRASNRSRSRSPLSVHRESSQAPHTEPTLQHRSSAYGREHYDISEPSLRSHDYTHSDYVNDRDYRYRTQENDGHDNGYEIRSETRIDWDHTPNRPSSRQSTDSRHYEPQPQYKYSERRSRILESESLLYFERGIDHTSRSMGYRCSSKWHDQRSRRHDSIRRSSQSPSTHSSRTSRTLQYASNHTGNVPLADSPRTNGTVDRRYERLNWDRPADYPTESTHFVWYRDMAEDRTKEFAPNRSKRLSSSQIIETSIITGTSQAPGDTAYTDYARTPPGPPPDLSDDVGASDFAKTPPGEPLENPLRS